MRDAKAMFSAILDMSNVFRATDITTKYMKQAIAEWFDLYYRGVGSDKESAKLRIPYIVVNKLSKTVFAEYSVTCDNEFASKVIDAANNAKKEAMQQALIGGECLLKPVPTSTGFYFTVIPRNNVQVFGRSHSGDMTDIGTSDLTIVNGYYYRLLERRTVDERGYLTLRHYLFRSRNETELGEKVPLNTLPQYENFADEYTFTKPVGSIGLIRMRTPVVNCVDGSKDGVSVYAAAVDLIHSINRNEAQIDGEFDRGESRVFVSADLLKPRIDKSEPKEIGSNLFVALDGDPEEMGITIFNPQLREQSFLARKQEYLRDVENIIGLKRGLLSEVEAAERTATEITSSAGEYNLTIIDLQRMWESTLEEVLRVCSVLGELYRVPGAGAVEFKNVAIAWGNGVLYDEAKTNQELSSQVSSGLLQPERYLGWYYNLPCETEAERAKIRKNYMPDASLEAGE